MSDWSGSRSVNTFTCACIIAAGHGRLLPEAEIECHELIESTFAVAVEATMGLTVAAAAAAAAAEEALVKAFLVNILTMKDSARMLKQFVTRVYTSRYMYTET